VLLEKLTGLQLVKKFPAFHGNLRFITALTSENNTLLVYYNVQDRKLIPSFRKNFLLLSLGLLNYFQVERGGKLQKEKKKTGHDMKF